jgi:formate hydrogenlyase subunit 3/multisubunit Na+/H+ antiporter MnhD subunit
MNPLFAVIAIPIIAALLMPIIGKIKWAKEIVTVLATAITFVASILLFNSSAEIVLPWVGQGFDFSLRVYPFSAFILLSAGFFGFLIAVYSAVFMQKKPYSKWFYFNYLLTLGFSCGAILANNFLLLMFFWEGLLVLMYAFIALASETPGSKATALKAFLINGVSDLCLLVGIGITVHIAGTFNMSEVHLSISGWGIGAFTLMMIGAISKAGSMPFHTWIPDAATDAQLPFMAYIPGSVEKVLGIYLLSRICFDFFNLSMSGPMKLVLMTIGGVTLLLAVLMALAQSDYKRLLSYHAISQVGYMILGIGTGTAIGIAGGIFHMINNALYKSGLFLTAGSIEHRTGTTSMYKLGGLFKRMPVTAICFVIFALSISGVPPFNGFFSKELIYAGTLKSGYVIFFIIAEVGSFLTLASFLKLGHAVYFDKRPQELDNVKESNIGMLFPIIAIAVTCLAFGFGAKIPLANFIAPSVEGTFAQSHHHLWGLHMNWLFFVTVGIIVMAFINHMFGFKRGKKACKASDHICKAPLFKTAYEIAERKGFDPYEHAMKFVGVLGRGFYFIDRVMDFFTDTLPASIMRLLSFISAKFHNGFYAHYLSWTLIGILLFVLMTTFGGIRP